ncbi:MAG: hypothetical protein HXY42_04235 [Chloroflexi bacterium]|nr:hypothetical protein [Chloroflexota bacterium]
MDEKKKSGSKHAATKSKSSNRGKAKPMEKDGGKKKVVSKAATGPKVKTEPVRVVNKISPPRIINGEERKPVRIGRPATQFNYMKAPGALYDFQVGDRVEVFCDHEKGRERIRGWIAGIVVQVDNKMVAVQFRSNVYLTDGWMVPDRILWYSLSSEHIRPLQGKKSTAREKPKAILEY